jgi:predicted transcriptional regulator of viral defense system
MNEDDGGAWAKRLHRIHRGVYAVGHQGLSKDGIWMAAVLACGPGAVLSHTSAARLWGMLRTARDRDGDSGPATSSLPVHVTVPGSARSRAGIHVHRSHILSPGEATRRAGIPVTTPSRTLTDLRRFLPQPQFAAALREAEFLRLPIDQSLEPDRTRSELEARFLALAVATAFPSLR